MLLDFVPPDTTGLRPLADAVGVVALALLGGVTAAVMAFVVGVRRRGRER
ncbi:hypothetical protein GXB85_16610 [Cellulomonas sp. APG4]|nr:hypothetical protein [Cellulomonas sp. APG4]NCT92558.1 hypothetical protein [Cellulomonas sp. APG4]